MEYEISRVLCDARILDVFEGAAEIQAHVIAQGLLERRNQGVLKSAPVQSTAHGVYRDSQEVCK